MTTPSHRQLVVHAEIKNNKGEVSQRYVDYQVFELWQRLMIDQHDFSVLSAKPCVWVPAEESRRNDQLFAHTHYQQSVSRLSFECYNQELGITETKLRFMAHNDLQAHADLVLQHLSQPHGVTTMEAASGVALSSLQQH